MPRSTRRNAVEEESSAMDVEEASVEVPQAAEGAAAEAESAEVVPAVAAEGAAEAKAARKNKKKRVCRTFKGVSDTATVKVRGHAVECSEHIAAAFARRVAHKAKIVAGSRKMVRREQALAAVSGSIPDPILRETVLDAARSAVEKFSESLAARAAEKKAAAAVEATA